MIRFGTPGLDAAGGLRADILADAGAIAAAVVEETRRVTFGLRDRLRGQVRQAFRPTPAFARKQYGQNVANTVKARVYQDPDGSVTGFVAWNWRLGRVHTLGRTITAGGERFLAIALPAASRLGLDRAEEERGGSNQFSEGNRAKRARLALAAGKFGRLHLIPTERGYLLAIERGQAEEAGLKSGRAKAKPELVPLFVLVRQVSLRGRVDFKGAIRAADAELGDAVARRLAALP